MRKSQLPISERLDDHWQIGHQSSMASRDVGHEATRGLEQRFGFACINSGRQRIAMACMRLACLVSAECSLSGLDGFIKASTLRGSLGKAPVRLYQTTGRSAGAVVAKDAD